MGSFPRGRGCSSGPLRPENLSCLCHRLSLFPQRPFWGTVVTVFKLKTGANPSFRSKPPGRPRVPEKTWRCSLGSDGSRCAGWPVLCGARPPGARREAGGGAEGASAGSPRPAPAAAHPAVLSAGPAGPVPHRPPHPPRAALQLGRPPLSLSNAPPPSGLSQKLGSQLAHPGVSFSSPKLFPLGILHVVWDPPHRTPVLVGPGPKRPLCRWDKLRRPEHSESVPGACERDLLRDRGP